VRESTAPKTKTALDFGPASKGDVDAAASHIANVHEPAGFNRAVVAFLTEA
jgi:hypothetical protein